MTYPVSINRCHDLIRKLEGEISELKAEASQAKDDRYSKKMEAMQTYDLTCSQAVIYVTLAAAGGMGVPAGRLLAALEADRPDARPDGSLNVQIYKMRVKLALHGLTIVNHIGRGYVLKDVSPGRYAVRACKPQGYWAKGLHQFLADADGSFSAAEMARCIGCHMSVARSFLLSRESNGAVRRSYKGGRVEWHKCNT